MTLTKIIYIYNIETIFLKKFKEEKLNLFINAAYCRVKLSWKYLFYQRKMQTINRRAREEIHPKIFHLQGLSILLHSFQLFINLIIYVL